MSVKYEERYFEGDGIELPGIKLTPEFPKGRIYFVHGLSGKYQDYDNLLTDLSYDFTICAYNQRGHAGVPGRFSVEQAAKDLESIITSEGMYPAGILGHSLGARTAVDVIKTFESQNRRISGVYLLEPCLGVDSFGFCQRAVIKSLSALYPISYLADLLLDKMPNLRGSLGFHNTHSLASMADISNLSSTDCRGIRAVVGYMLSDSDEVLGTKNQRHYFSSMAKLRELFPTNLGSDGPVAIDDSGVVKGLNHCYNSKNKLTPFMDWDKSLSRQKEIAVITGKIRRFFAHIFEKH